MNQPSELDHIIQKYSSPVPRYTSYPTAVELEPANSFRPVAEALKSTRTDTRGLYVHLPFCRNLCWFCACHKIVTQDRSIVRPYLADIATELALLTDAAEERPDISSLHLGGGSPSFLSPDEISLLCTLLHTGCRGLETAEKSIELDPRTTSRSLIERLAAHGFTRASLGVQDFEPVVQAFIHRVQPYDLVAETTATLRDNGFDSINFDLIYGLPGQTEVTIRRTAELVAALRPDRIAAYGYAHVSWKAKAQFAMEKYGLPTPDERVRLFDQIEQVLVDAGYVPVGLDHFALEDDALSIEAQAGRVSRSFMGYTTLNPSSTLAVGLSGISDIGEVMWQNATKLEDYSRAVRSGTLPIVKIKQRSRDDLVRSYVIQRIMCEGEIRLSQVPFSLTDEVTDLVERVAPNLKELERDGLIAWDGDRISATFHGRYFLRTFASVFDAYSNLRAGRTFSSAL
jgi:oxygen-independent coproporphyrinogen III oxidase